MADGRQRTEQPTSQLANSHDRPARWRDLMFWPTLIVGVAFVIIVYGLIGYFLVDVALWLFWSVRSH